MSDDQLKIANLDDEQQAKLQALEAELDAHIMGYEPYVAVKPLNEDQLKKLRALEEELGVILIAYRPQK